MFELHLGLLSISCLGSSSVCCLILFNYFSSIPSIKKNVLTRLDELLVLQLTFSVFCQCSVCLFSLVTNWRNDYLYLIFFIVMCSSLLMSFSILVALSFSRVFILLIVSNEDDEERIEEDFISTLLLRGGLNMC